MRTNIALYQALVSIDISEERAKAAVDALEGDMLNQLATKSDIQTLKAELELKLTIRMGVMLSVAVGVIITAIRFM